MSHKFSSTTASFGNSNVYRSEKQEDLIRQIALNQFMTLFQDIKIEIQTKIKSIDKNINQLRNQVSQVKKQSQQSGHSSSLADIIQKLQKVEAQIQVLRYNQQFQMRASRARSYDKDRKPIFKKNSREQEDFGNVVLGLQNQLQKGKVEKVKGLKTQPPKASSPDRQQNTQKSSLSIESVPKSGNKSNKSEPKVTRNPVLDSSTSIHRWLNENNNKSEFSCFNEIIKEEDIQESLFY